jgi:uncharacterized membrane protein YedE/YeeE
MSAKNSTLSLIVSFLVGAIFAAGLVISGMTQASKVIGFLDITGAWDPSLAFVMIGAIGAHALAYHLWLKKRNRPYLAEVFALPHRKDIDKRLIGGAALFGIGWGMSGFCPGPALVSLVSGNESVLAFVAAMLAGMALYHIQEKAPTHQSSTPKSARH